MTARKALLCAEPGCRRTREPHYAYCWSHVEALLMAGFGPR